jgi:S-disulfanyl-L-cysteine oxidoreductase SoxD
MSRFISATRQALAIAFAITLATALAALACAPLAAAAGPQPYAGIGRSATAAEIKAWDIDVRADFKGLPPGLGSVANGQQLWEAKCESCQLTEVFTPIAGGISAQDMQAGRTANLRRPDFPQRSTLMKLSQVSTLWDYIHRAMPWNAPKSLSNDEVYALTAYVLSLGDIVPADFVLSDKNIREVQARLPNRNGMVKYPPMWTARAAGDVRNARCMHDCPQQMEHMSALPDYARNHHGNLAEQNRSIGPTRGVDTTRAATAAGGPAPVAAMPAAPSRLSAHELAQKHACTACHRPDRKLVGPSHAEIAARYRGNAAAETLLMAKVRAGGTGVWGPNVMPPHVDIGEDDLRALVRWSLSGGN